MRPVQISVTASALTSDARAAPRLARQAGFGGLVFDAYSAALNLPELSSSGRREFRRLLSAEAQPLVAVQCDLGAKGFGPGADVERELSHLDRAMEVAAELGAGCVCVELGPLPPAPIRAKPKPAVTREQAGLIILPAPAPAPEQPTAPPPDPSVVSQVNTALSELCARADRYRMTVALSSSLSSFVSLQHAMTGVACPWFGVDLDPVAILRDEWDSDEVFSVLGPLIRHVRARDAVVGADRRTRPAVVGRGSVEWSRLVASLDESGYRGSVTMDPTELPDRAAAALAGREFLGRL
jgi:sugar phosphate isomerase/epimerase